MAGAVPCQSDLEGRGVGDADRRWLLRLVTTRCIVIVPTVHTMGYDCKSPTEDGIDPNQNFTYDLTD